MATGPRLLQAVADQTDRYGDRPLYEVDRPIPDHGLLDARSPRVLAGDWPTHPVCHQKAPVPAVAAPSILTREVPRKRVH